MDASDVTTTATFAQLPIRESLQRALRAMRFFAPSPIQRHALPLALFGSDVIGQAKSGTGKTAVFGLAALEHVLQRFGPMPSDPLGLILAPTREIAMQIDAVLRELGAKTPQEIHVVPLIGGLPVAHDQRRLRAGCHIAVGTPGRVRWLMEDGVFRPTAIRLLVFDEVDKLLSGEFMGDIEAIVSAIPSRRQTLAFSATFTPEQLVHIVRLMRDPQVVRVRGPTEVTVELVPSDESMLAEWIEREKQQHEPELWLRHVRQFFRVVPLAISNDPLHLKSKLVVLASLLSEMSFHQCMVFCNDKFRAEALATALASQGWPAAAITGAQSQTTRNEVMDQFRAVAIRVLVSTDLTARGIDVDKVNFVVNLDLPRDPATYLHRVGRTGRFGGKGLAVTLLTPPEVDGIRLLGRVFEMAVDELPSPVPPDIRAYAVVGSAPKNEADERGHNDVEADEVRPTAGWQSDGPDVTGERPQAVTESMPAKPRGAADAHVGDMSAIENKNSEEATATSALAWEEHCYAQWLRLLSVP